MATKHNRLTKGTRGIDEPETFVEPGQVIDDDDEPTQAELDEEQLFAEVGAAPEDSVVHVYILRGEKEPKVWRGPPASFDIERIAKGHGTGDYRVMLYSRTAAGGLARRINRVVSVQLSADEDARIAAIRSGKPDPLAAPALTAEAIAAAVRAAMPQQSPTVIQSPQNVLGLIREVGEIIRPMIQPQAQQANMNPLEMVRMFAEIVRDTRRAEIDEEIPRGGASGYDLLWKVVDKFGPLFQNALNQQAAQPGQPAQITNASNPPTQTVVAPSSEQGEQMLRLKMGLGFLVMQAEAKNDPATYADVILDNVPEEDLKRLISAPDFVEQLSAIDPKVAMHRQWFTDLKKAIDDALADEGDDNEGGEGAPGAA